MGVPASGRTQIKRHGTNLSRLSPSQQGNKKDAHPIPRIDDNFDALRCAKFFSTQDLASGFHQISVEIQDQKKTGCVTPWGYYE